MVNSKPDVAPLCYRCFAISFPAPKLNILMRSFNPRPMILWSWISDCYILSLLLLSECLGIVAFFLRDQWLPKLWGAVYAKRSAAGHLHADHRFCFLHCAESAQQIGVGDWGRCSKITHALDLRRCVHFYEINKNGLLWRRRFGKPKRCGCKMLTSKYRIKHWKVFRKTQKAKYTSHYILHIFLIFSPLRTKQQIRTFSLFSSCFDVKLLTWNNQQPPFPLEDWIVFQPIKKERALLCNRAPFQGRSGWNLCRQENVQTPGSVAVT